MLKILTALVLVGLVADAAVGFATDGANALVPVVGFSGLLGCRIRRLDPDIVRKHVRQRTFVVLPKCWVVERTFAWLGRCRRLSKDYEAAPASSEAWIRLAMIHLMLKRLAPT